MWSAVLADEISPVSGNLAHGPEPNRVLGFRLQRKILLSIVAG